MKLVDLFETNDSVNDHVIKQASEQIVEHCMPYLKEHKSFAYNPILRGFRSKFDTILQQHDVRPNRQPKDMPVTLHQVIDEWFSKTFNHRFRSNAVFATPSLETAEEYGYIRPIYPIGHFTYVWSDQVYDLFTQLNDYIQAFVVQSYNEKGDSEKEAKWKGYQFLSRMLNNQLEQHEQEYLKQLIEQFLEQSNYKQTNLSQATQVQMKFDYQPEIMIATETYYSVAPRADGPVARSVEQRLRGK